MLIVLEEFRGKSVLVVEDEYILAQELEASHAKVIGPVPTVEQALALIDEHRVDVAILDVVLEAEVSFPIANALEANGIPFVFVTTKLVDDVPEEYQRFVLEKDASWQAIGQKLFGERPH